MFLETTVMVVQWVLYVFGGIFRLMGMAMTRSMKTEAWD